MKRILLLIKGLGRGGAEQLLVNAAPYLDRQRFEYEVAYLLPWKDALVGELEQEDLEVTCLEGGRGLAWAGRLGDLIRRRGIDLLHTHSPYPAAVARGAFGRKECAVVHTEHNLWDRYHKATYWANLLTFRHNKHVFAVSDHVRSSIRYPRGLTGLKMPPLETLYHGPDPAAISQWASLNGARQELGIADNARVVGTVANFKSHKGYEYLIDAVAEVRRHVPDVRFVLVGRGPMEPEMRSRSARAGVENAVIFAGYREDAPRIVKSFDLFVLPSIHEGLSIALVEAMALGKPSVVTRAGGLPEVIEDGRQGFVVPPRDPHALAQRIVQVLDDPAMARRFGDAAIERAADFDIRNSVRRSEEVYESVLA